MIVEFMGIPGSGKTYLSDLIIKSNVLSFKIQDVVEKRRNRLASKVFYKLFDFVLLICPSYWKKRRELNRILVNYYNRKAHYEKVGLNYYINAILEKKYIYHLYGDSKKLVLMSEGIAQELINMMVNFDVDYDTLAEVYKCIDIEIGVIYIMNTINDSIESIEKRNRHVCYIDELNGNDLRDFLVRYDECCKKLYTLFRFLLIEKYSDMSDTYKRIMEFVTK